MKNKNLIISLMLFVGITLVGASLVWAEESPWQNLNPRVESGLSGTVYNCSPLTVSNGTVAAYPGCAITCNSGYNLSGGICVQSSSGGGTGGGGGGGGSFSATVSTCVSVDYGEWLVACVDNLQYRSVVSKTPSDCSLTASQEAGKVRACSSITGGTDAGQVLGTKIIDVTSEEESLTTKIDTNLAKRLAGRILLQVERFGQAWYLDPVSLKRYYLADKDGAYNALRKFGLGIKNADIAKIPVGYESRFSMTDTDKDGLPDKLEQALGTNSALSDTDKDGVSDGNEVLKNNTNPLGAGRLVYSSSLVNRLRGRIIIQTESHGEAWYINPADGKRYYLADGEAAYQIMRYLSLGISNKDIRKITVGSWE